MRFGAPCAFYWHSCILVRPVCFIGMSMKCILHVSCINLHVFCMYLACVACALPVHFVGRWRVRPVRPVRDIICINLTRVRPVRCGALYLYYWVLVRLMNVFCMYLACILHVLPVGRWCALCAWRFLLEVFLCACALYWHSCILMRPVRFIVMNIECILHVSCMYLACICVYLACILHVSWYGCVYLACILCVYTVLLYVILGFRV